MSLYINNREYPNVINQLNSSWIKKYLNNEIKEDDIEKLEGLTSIKRYAFYRQSFTNITLPKSVVEINDHAFSDSLVSVKIPLDYDLKYIRDNKFSRRINLHWWRRLSRQLSSWKNYSSWEFRIYWQQRIWGL